jgi:Flp pilus assembly CpaF family ATPase
MMRRVSAERALGAREQSARVKRLVRGTLRKKPDAIIAGESK